MLSALFDARRNGKALILMVLSLLLARTAQAQQLYWTPWVSEENGGPPAACGRSNEGVVGFGCQGSYCDQVRALCETYPAGIFEGRPMSWSAYFSEEHDGVGLWRSSGWYPWDESQYHVCNSGMTSGIMTGIRCNGSYCDNVSIECVQPMRTYRGTTYRVPLKDCAWSSWQSEEQGSRDFGWNRYITGLECAGSYCDSKRFLVCSLDLDPNHLVPNW